MNGCKRLLKKKQKKTDIVIRTSQIMMEQEEQQKLMKNWEVRDTRKLIMEKIEQTVRNGGTLKKRLGIDRLQPFSPKDANVNVTANM